MHNYQLVAATPDDATIQSGEASPRFYTNTDDRKRRLLTRVYILLGLMAAATCGFVAGAFSFSRGRACTSGERGTLPAAAPRIPLPSLESVFTYDSEFAREPPVGPGSGQQAEPIWDSLVPSTWVHMYLDRPNP